MHAERALLFWFPFCILSGRTLAAENPASARDRFPPWLLVTWCASSVGTDYQRRAGQKRSGNVDAGLSTLCQHAQQLGIGAWWRLKRGFAEANCDNGGRA